MENFETLERSNPKFKNYLLGNFSKELVAIPVQSFQINQPDEKITFQILPTAQIRRPSVIKILFQLIRMELLTLTVIPALTVACSLYNTGYSFWNLSSALFALVFLHASIFCRNDFIDHMSGIDRLHEKGGSQVIQKGWLSAIAVQRLHYLFLTLALIFALPIFIFQTKVILLSIAVAVFGIIGYSHLRWGNWHWVFGDLAVFLCLGPFLTLGMAWALTLNPILLNIVQGFFLGTLALIYVISKQCISMVIDQEAQMTTLPIRIGFDRTKNVLQSLLFASTVMLALFTFYFMAQSPSIPFLIFEILGLCSVIVLIGNIYTVVRNINSPLASKLYTIPKKLLDIHLIAGVFLCALYLV